MKNNYLKIKGLLKDAELPVWFRALNLLFLLPILLWPIVFFASIFIFDNPKSLIQTFLLFIFINLYPIYLIVIATANAKLYRKNKPIAVLLPCLFLIPMLLAVSHYSSERKEELSRAAAEEDFLFARTPETSANIEYKNPAGVTPLQNAVLLDRYDAVLHLLKSGADYNQVIVDRGQFSSDGKKMYLADMLREYLPELNSKDYTIKMEVVDFLMTKGIDYKKIPISDYTINEIKKLHPDDWKSYVEKY